MEEPTEQAIATIMIMTGMDYIQAYHHLVARLLVADLLDREQNEKVEKAKETLGKV